MTAEKYRIFKRCIAFVLIVTLTVTSLPAFASDVSSPRKWGSNSLDSRVRGNDNVDLNIPAEIGAISEHYRSGSEKTIVYLEDAHDSLEAQENIAKLIHLLVDTQHVKTVFEEGYEGPVPTDDYFKSINDPVIREKISYFLLDKLRIGGAEYAHINRKKDFKLIGADSIKLHLQNVGWYRKAAKDKEITEKDLAALQFHIENLANRYFPEELKEWMKFKEKSDRGELDLISYLDRARDIFVKKIGAETFQTKYPHIELLRFARNTDDPEIYEQVKSVKPVALFQEIDRMEYEFSRAFLENDRDQKIFDYYKGIALIKRLSNIEINADEFEAVKNTLLRLKTEPIAHFIVDQTGKSVVLSKRWEAHIQNAIEYYETSRKRDRVIKKEFADFLTSSSEDTAVLVFGGFHKSRIREILRRTGVSYVIVTPKITSLNPKHKNYYKQLMSVGHYAFEVPFNVHTGARPPNSFEINPNFSRHFITALQRVITPDMDLRNPLSMRRIEDRLKNTGFGMETLMPEPYLKNWTNRGFDVLDDAYGLSSDLRKAERRNGEPLQVLLIGAGQGVAAMEMALLFPDIEISAVNLERELWSDDAIKTRNKAKGLGWRRYDPSELDEARKRISVHALNAESEEEMRSAFSDRSFDFIIFETRTLMYFRDKVRAIERIYNEFLKVGGIFAFETGFTTYIFEFSSQGKLEENSGRIIKDAFDKSGLLIRENVREDMERTYLKYRKDKSVHIPLILGHIRSESNLVSPIHSYYQREKLAEPATAAAGFGAARIEQQNAGIELLAKAGIMQIIGENVLSNSHKASVLRLSELWLRKPRLQHPFHSSFDLIVGQIIKPTANIITMPQNNPARRLLGSEAKKPDAAAAAIKTLTISISVLASRFLRDGLSIILFFSKSHILFNTTKNCLNIIYRALPFVNSITDSHRQDVSGLKTEPVPTAGFGAKGKIRAVSQQVVEQKIIKAIEKMPYRPDWLSVDIVESLVHELPRLIQEAKPVFSKVEQQSIIVSHVVSNATKQDAMRMASKRPGNWFDWNKLSTHAHGSFAPGKGIWTNIGAVDSPRHLGMPTFNLHFKGSVLQHTQASEVKNLIHTFLDEHLKRVQKNINRNFHLFPYLFDLLLFYFEIDGIEIHQHGEREQSLDWLVIKNQHTAIKSIDLLRNEVHAKPDAAGFGAEEGRSMREQQELNAGEKHASSKKRSSRSLFYKLVPDEEIEKLPSIRSLRRVLENHGLSTKLVIGDEYIKIVIPKKIPFWRLGLLAEVDQFLAEGIVETGVTVFVSIESETEFRRYFAPDIFTPESTFDILRHQKGRELVELWTTIFPNHGRSGYGKDILELFDYLADPRKRTGNYVADAIKKFPILNDMQQLYTKATKPSRDVRSFDLPAVVEKEKFLRPFILGPRLLDIGAGLDIFTERSLHFNPAIQEAIGVDIEKQRDYSYDIPRAKKHEFKLMKSPSEIPIENKWANTAILSFVLHHVDVNIEDYLAEVFRTIQPGGRVLILEDTFPSQIDAAAVRGDLSDEHFHLAELFLQLPSDELRLSFLHFVDWFNHNFINRIRTPLVPGNYRMMEEWKELFEKAGFRVMEQKYLGFRKIGSQNPVSRGLFVLERPAGFGAAGGVAAKNKTGDFNLHERQVVRGKTGFAELNRSGRTKNDGSASSKSRKAALGIRSLLSRMPWPRQTFQSSLEGTYRTTATANSSMVKKKSPPWTAFGNSAKKREANAAANAIFTKSINVLARNVFLGALSIFSNLWYGENSYVIKSIINLLKIIHRYLRLVKRYPNPLKLGLDLSFGREKTSDHSQGLAIHNGFGADDTSAVQIHRDISKRFDELSAKASQAISIFIQPGRVPSGFWKSVPLEAQRLMVEILSEEVRRDPSDLREHHFWVQLPRLGNKTLGGMFGFYRYNNGTTLSSINTLKVLKSTLGFTHKPSLKEFRWKELYRDEGRVKEILGVPDLTTEGMASLIHSQRKLTKQEEDELAFEIRSGNGAARDAAILIHKPLVPFAIRKYVFHWGNVMNRADVWEVAEKELLRRIEVFSAKPRTYRFSTYAVPALVDRILRQLKKTEREMGQLSKDRSEVNGQESPHQQFGEVIVQMIKYLRDVGISDKYLLVFKLRADGMALREIGQSVDLDYRQVGRIMNKLGKLLRSEFNKEDLVTTGFGAGGKPEVFLNKMIDWTSHMSKYDLREEQILLLNLLDEIWDRIDWVSERKLRIQLINSGLHKYGGWKGEFGGLLEKIPKVISVKMARQDLLEIEVEEELKQEEKALVIHRSLSLLGALWMNPVLFEDTPDFLDFVRWIAEYKYQVVIKESLLPFVSSDGGDYESLFEQLRLTAASKIVEIGHAGRGHVPKGYQGITVDIQNPEGREAEGMIKADGLEFLENQSAEQSLDAIIFNHSLWYVVRETVEDSREIINDRLRRISEASFRSLKPNGVIIMADTIPENIEYMVKFASDKNLKVHVYKQYYSFPRPKRIPGKRQSDGRVRNEGFIVIQKETPEQLTGFGAAESPRPDRIELFRKAGIEIYDVPNIRRPSEIFHIMAQGQDRRFWDITDQSGNPIGAFSLEKKWGALSMINIQIYGPKNWNQGYGISAVRWALQYASKQFPDAKYPLIFDLINNPVAFQFAEYFFEPGSIEILDPEVKFEWTDLDESGFERKFGIFSADWKTRLGEIRVAGNFKEGLRVVSKPQGVEARWEGLKLITKNETTGAFLKPVVEGATFALRGKPNKKVLEDAVQTGFGTEQKSYRRDRALLKKLQTFDAVYFWNKTKNRVGIQRKQKLGEAGIPLFAAYVLFRIFQSKGTNAFISALASVLIAGVTGLAYLFIKRLLFQRSPANHSDFILRKINELLTISSQIKTTPYQARAVYAVDKIVSAFQKISESDEFGTAELKEILSAVLRGSAVRKTKARASLLSTTEMLAEFLRTEPGLEPLGNEDNWHFVSSVVRTVVQRKEASKNFDSELTARLAQTVERPSTDWLAKLREVLNSYDLLTSPAKSAGFGAEEKAADLDGRRANLAQKLSEAGLKDAVVDDAFISIYETAYRASAGLDLARLYSSYLSVKDQLEANATSAEYEEGKKVRKFILTGFRVRPEEIRETGTASFVVGVGEGKHVDKETQDEPFLRFARDILKIRGVAMRRSVEEELWGLPQAQRHFQVEHVVTDYLLVPTPSAPLVDLYFVLGDALFRRILFRDSSSDSAEAEVKLGLRNLGKSSFVRGVTGRKETGFLLFENVGLVYTPGIVLSERLVNAILKIAKSGTPENLNPYLPFIKEAMRANGVDPGKDLFSVRSNPKFSMPGILETVEETQDLLEGIKKAAAAWDLPRAKAYRELQDWSDDYDLPLIIQKWVSGKSPDPDYKRKRREMPESTPLYAAGAFSTRNPDTGEDVLFGEYLENARGSELMSGTKVGQDIEQLREIAPDIYAQLLEAKTKLEKIARFPQEIEFVIESGKLYFLQTRALNFSAKGGLRYLNGQLAFGQLNDVKALPYLIALQEHLKGRRIYKLNDAIDAPAISRGIASTPGAFQGYAVLSIEEAERRMKRKEPIIFVAYEEIRDQVISMLFGYPDSGLITLYGDKTSHEAMMSRLSGVASIINLENASAHYAKKNYADEGSPVELENGEVIQEGDMLVIDGDQNRVYKVKKPDVSWVEIDGAVQDASHGVDIPEYKARFLRRFLNADGSIKERFTIERLRVLNEKADIKFKVSDNGGEARATLLANLKKHLIHQLLRQKEEEKNDSGFGAAAGDTPKRIQIKHLLDRLGKIEKAVKDHPTLPHDRWVELMKKLHEVWPLLRTENYFEAAQTLSKLIHDPGVIHYQESYLSRRSIRSLVNAIERASVPEELLQWFREIHRKLPEKNEDRFEVLGNLVEKLYGVELGEVMAKIKKASDDEIKQTPNQPIFAEAVLEWRKKKQFDLLFYRYASIYPQSKWLEGRAPMLNIPLGMSRHFGPTAWALFINHFARKIAAQQNHSGFGAELDRPLQTEDIAKLAALSHPALPRVQYDGDRYEIEQIKGRKMSDWLVEESGKLEDDAFLKKLIGWMVTITDGMDLATKAGLKHKDLQVSNIVIEDGTERPVITDFFNPILKETDELSDLLHMLLNVLAYRIQFIHSGGKTNALEGHELSSTEIKNQMFRRFPELAEIIMGSRRPKSIADLRDALTSATISQSQTPRPSGFGAAEEDELLNLIAAQIPGLAEKLEGRAHRKKLRALAKLEEITPESVREILQSKQFRPGIQLAAGELERLIEILKGGASQAAPANFADNVITPTPPMALMTGSVQGQEDMADFYMMKVLPQFAPQIGDLVLKNVKPGADPRRFMYLPDPDEILRHGPYQWGFYSIVGKFNLTDGDPRRDKPNVRIPTVIKVGARPHTEYSELVSDELGIIRDFWREGRRRYLPEPYLKKPFMLRVTMGKAESGVPMDTPAAVYQWFEGDPKNPFEGIRYIAGQWYRRSAENGEDILLTPDELRAVQIEMAAAIAYHTRNTEDLITTVSGIDFGAGHFLYRKQPGSGAEIKLTAVHGLKKNISIARFISDLINASALAAKVTEGEESRNVTFKLKQAGFEIERVWNAGIALEGLVKGLEYRAIDLRSAGVTEEQARQEGRAEAVRWLELFLQSSLSEPYRNDVNSFLAKLKSATGFGVAVGRDPKSVSKYLDKILGDIQNKKVLENDPAFRSELSVKLGQVKALVGAGKSFQAAGSLSGYILSTKKRFEENDEVGFFTVLFSLARSIEAVSLSPAWNESVWWLTPLEKTNDRSIRAQREKAFNDILLKVYGITLGEIAAGMRQAGREELLLIPTVSHRTPRRYGLNEAIFIVNQFDPDGAKKILQRIVLKDLLIREDEEIRNLKLPVRPDLAGYQASPHDVSGHTVRAWAYAIHHFAMKAKLSKSAGFGTGRAAERWDEKFSKDLGVRMASSLGLSRAKYHPYSGDEDRLRVGEKTYGPDVWEGKITADGKTQYGMAFIRIGFLFIMDERAYSVLNPALKIELGQNVIRIEHLDKTIVASPDLGPFSMATIAAMFQVNFTGKRLMDMGAGDGILSLVAAKLGASSVVLIEHDAFVLEKAVGSLKLNGLEENKDFVAMPISIGARQKILRAVGRLPSPERGTAVAVNIGYWLNYKVNNGHAIRFLNNLSQVTEATDFIAGGYATPHQGNHRFLLQRDQRALKAMGFDIFPEQAHYFRHERAWLATREPVSAGFGAAEVLSAVTASGRIMRLKDADEKLRDKFLTQIFQENLYVPKGVKTPDEFKRAYLNPLDSGKDFETFVVFGGNEIAGLINIKLPGTAKEKPVLNYVQVLKDFRERGLAYELIVYALQLFISRGTYEVETSAIDPSAKEFWVKTSRKLRREPFVKSISKADVQFTGLEKLRFKLQPVPNAAGFDADLERLRPHFEEVAQQLTNIQGREWVVQFLLGNRSSDEIFTAFSGLRWLKQDEFDGLYNAAGDEAQLGGVLAKRMRALQALIDRFPDEWFNRPVEFIKSVPTTASGFGAAQTPGFSLRKVVFRAPASGAEAEQLAAYKKTLNKQFGFWADDIAKEKAAQLNKHIRKLTLEIFPGKRLSNLSTELLSRETLVESLRKLIDMPKQSDNVAFEHILKEMEILLTEEIDDEVTLKDKITMPAKEWILAVKSFLTDFDHLKNELIQLTQWDFLNRFPNASGMYLWRGLNDEETSRFLDFEQGDTIMLKSNFYSQSPLYAQHFVKHTQNAISLVFVPVKALLSTSWLHEVWYTLYEPEVIVSGNVIFRDLFFYDSVADQKRFKRMGKIYERALAKTPHVDERDLRPESWVLEVIDEPKSRFGVGDLAKAAKQQHATVDVSMVDSLATDVVFAIEAKTIQNLSAEKWKELLALKALNQEKLHILIRYDRIEELASPRAEELRNDFKNVRVGVWSNRLPPNAPVFYFSDPAEGVHPSERLDTQLTRRIHGRYFGLLFGVALLYEFHEENLPGLVNMNGYWNDPTGWYASEVLNLLFNSYVAVARAA